MNRNIIMIVLIFLLSVNSVYAGTTFLGDIIIGRESGINKYIAFTDDFVYLYINITNSLGIKKSDITHEWLGFRILNRTTLQERPGASWSFVTADWRVMEISKMSDFNKIYKYTYDTFDHKKSFKLIFSGKYKKFRVSPKWGNLGSILEYCYAFRKKDGSFVVENIVSIFPYECWDTYPCY